MKTIGLLGGTGWSSTIGYYKLLNEMVHERLGGFHSAKILLKSVDYHDIMMNYGKKHDVVANLLKNELKELISLKPDCIIICCNSLHKYYDLIKGELDSKIPIMHAVELVAQYIKEKNHHKILLLATKFTMEDGFFEKVLTKQGIAVTVPDAQEREKIHLIHNELMENKVTDDAKKYFHHLIEKYGDLDAIVLGCTEFPLVVNQANSNLPLIDPVYLQVGEAVRFSLDLPNFTQNDKHNYQNNSSFKEKPRRSSQPQTIAVLFRHLRPGSQYEQYYSAWLPHLEGKDPRQEPLEYYDVPVQAINAVNVNDPSEIISIGLIYASPECVFEKYKNYAESDAKRGDQIDKFCERESQAKVYRIQDINELGVKR